MFDNDVPKMRCVIRGFVGAIQVTEHETLVESQSEAWTYASTYFGFDASLTECDRYTVDTYWVF